VEYVAAQKSDVNLIASGVNSADLAHRVGALHRDLVAYAGFDKLAVCNRVLFRGHFNEKFQAGCLVI
jgi:hypothetical protein